MNYFILLSMIFLHVVDDYYLQGILASMKQKKWWTDKIPDFEKSRYTKDYIIALLMHGFSWSFMVMLPIIFINNFNVDFNLFSVVLANGFLHSFIDNIKVNKYKINLIEDQFLHLLQILSLWIYFT